MDKDEYVTRARAIQEQAEREIEPLIRGAALRPWRWTGTLATMATVMQHTINELRALPAPVDDAAEIERHFLTPLTAATESIDREPHRFHKAMHRLQVRKAFKGLAAVMESGDDPADTAWCSAYGLLQPRTGSHSTPRSGVDRAAAVGLATVSKQAVFPLSHDELRHLAWGGPLRPLIVLAAVLGLLCAGLAATSATSPGAPIVSGVCGFALFAGAFLVSGRRKGGRVVAAVGQQPTPIACVLVVYAVGTGRAASWEIAVAPTIGTAAPVAAHLAARPPRSVRGASAASVFGDPTPEGFFAVRFSSGLVLGTARPARPSPSWPPRHFRARHT